VPSVALQWGGAITAAGQRFHQATDEGQQHGDAPWVGKKSKSSAADAITNSRGRHRP
jgi:hypothetical protein